MPKPESSPTNFNPCRLEIARKRRGLTQATLARLVRLTPKTISAYEAGTATPSPETISSLSRALTFPEAFFFGPDLEKPSKDGASFRSLSRMTAKQRDMALAQGSLALLVSQWIEKKFELPDSQVPDLRHLQNTPEAAADTLRRMWGLGELPIRNMVHLLESEGVRVFSLSIDAKEVDAFSIWVNDTPFIFLNNFKSAERSRFDAAHELGHLVLDRHGCANSSKELEMRADAFASALLMPSRSIIADHPRFPTIQALMSLKKAWGVALSAIVYRLHKLQLLSEWHYRALCIEIGKRGYRAQEPDESPRETSLIFPAILKDLYQTDGVGKAGIAKDLSIPVSELDCLWFGLTLNAVQGARRKKPSPENGPALFRVK